MESTQKVTIRPIADNMKIIKAFPLDCFKPITSFTHKKYQITNYHIINCKKRFFSIIVNVIMQ